MSVSFLALLHVAGEGRGFDPRFGFPFFSLYPPLAPFSLEPPLKVKLAVKRHLSVLHYEGGGDKIKWQVHKTT